jgi:hypothetical protein
MTPARRPALSSSAPLPASSQDFIRPLSSSRVSREPCSTICAITAAWCEFLVATTRKAFIPGAIKASMLTVPTRGLSSTISPPPRAKRQPQKASASPLTPCCRSFRRTRPRSCACRCWKASRCGRKAGELGIRPMTVSRHEKVALAALREQLA